MKYYSFNTITDYIFYLSEIISDCHQKKSRLEKYLGEIDILIKENPVAKSIEADLYEEISDKSLRLIQYLSNLIGDNTKWAMSYSRFRKVLESNKNKLWISINELKKSELDLLHEFNSLRNWWLHIPESLIISKRNKLILDNNIIELYKHNILRVIYKYYELKYLKELQNEVREFLVSTNSIFLTMITDYDLLIKSKSVIEFETWNLKPYLLMDIVQDSLNIHNNQNLTK